MCACKRKKNTQITQVLYRGAWLKCIRSRLKRNRCVTMSNWRWLQWVYLICGTAWYCGHAVNDAHSLWSLVTFNERSNWAWPSNELNMPNSQLLNLFESKSAAFDSSSVCVPYNFEFLTSYRGFGCWANKKGARNEAMRWIYQVEKFEAEKTNESAKENELDQPWQCERARYIRLGLLLMFPLTESVMMKMSSF